jgi:pyruvate/2-oxoglutarate dehydrogenase complex dihydrolipoamide dehydrogenase (E3) component
MPEHFDVAVIGTGQSGPALARALADAGRNVAVAERAAFGGSCVNHGCVPTKVYVACARVAHVARNATEYGVQTGDIKVDLRKIKARKEKQVEGGTEGIEKSLVDHDNIKVFRSHARFVGPKRLKVNDSELTADLLVINTGARARVPDIEGLDSVPWLSSTDMLELNDLPGHLLVVGGGYIGIEFAQMFRRFGSKVTVIQRDDRLLPQEDADISTAVQEILEHEGIEVRTGTAPDSVSGTAGDINVAIGSETLRGSHLLVATGRVPNTDDLGLSEAGIETDERGYITVDERLSTSADGVLALGDCNGRGAFTHTSYHDFQVAKDRLLGDDRRRVSDRIPCHAVFMDPPLGRVGMSEREARDSGRRLLKATMPMKHVGRARELGETRGFMKVIVDADTERVLGAMILGVRGDEVVHTLADLMYAEASYKVLRDAVHIHPTVSELLPTLLEGLEPVD